MSGESLEERLSKGGQLRDLQNSRFATMRNKFTEGTWAEFEDAVGSIFSDAIGPDDKTDYSAICLYAESDVTKIIPGQENNENEDAGFLVKVIARIPDLHASLPKPSSQMCETERNLAIAMHPVFYSFQGDNSKPEPGNDVKVKFFTQGQAQYGEYLGIINANKASPQKTNKTARDAIECGESAPSTIAEATARREDG